MPTSLDCWEGNMGSFDKYLSHGLTNNRCLMDASSLRSLPRKHHVTPPFSCLPLPFALNPHTHTPSSWIQRSCWLPDVFADLIWTWTHIFALRMWFGNEDWMSWKLSWAYRTLRVKLQTHLETNSSFFGISFTGENTNHVPYTHRQAKIWTITLWKWEINTHACTYLCQLFPLMYLFQSFNKNYTFWPCKSPTVNKHFKVTNKIPFLSFPQPWIQSSSWGIEQGIQKSTGGPCPLSHWSPHLFLKRIRGRNSFKIYNSFHSEGWKSGLRNLEVSSIKVQGKEVPRDFWHTDIFSSFTKLTKLRRQHGGCFFITLCM